ncbi:DNA-directed RNA polymerase subunit alpha C-terminal domain-containing protein [Chryseobacterium sp. MDT2-18]|uniref:DNA-directed RNA polymerase subunit alpha C-terminal domain-containing protein n=1 Tax=Chryseobacterium sp. MDT2-18 TaxID=1259136 RepID=UPI0027D788E4|nr:DNA-directed RNA polymerase subunit alpha C-terminal domain-containing protein [Chryseobacterium sp. MDT2-18]
MKWINHKNTVRRNTIFLKIYRKAWEKEHVILWRLVEQSASVEELSAEYGIEKDDILTMYQRLLLVVHSLDKQLSKVQQAYWRKQKRRRYHLVLAEKRRRNAVLSKKLKDSSFPLSCRLYNVLYNLDISTVRDLTNSPIPEFLNYRGFGRSSMNELIEFIEFEHLESYFKGFQKHKKKYYYKSRNNRR